MKCANCGAEIRVGCVYCSACGKEAQIVSDYNLLEDDFLRDLLKENKQKVKADISASKKEKTSDIPAEKKSQPPVSSKKKRGKNTSFKWAVLAIVVLIFLIIGIVLFTNYARNNSYDYQIKQAKDYKEENDYRNAEKCLKRALELDNTRINARMLLAEVYHLQENLKDSADMLLEVIELEPKNKKAYQQLIQIYEEEKNYKAIQELNNRVTDEDIFLLFEDYLPKEPDLSPDGGIFQTEFTVEISGEEGCTIYYTMDGSDPKDGIEYTEPILIEPVDNIKIRAIACNEFGFYSEETEEDYQIKLKKPDTPRVTPKGGSFYGEQTVSVYVPDGCSVYYTWDGTAPTENSARYTEPLLIPEGNNILSLVLVDKYGMKSDVLKCNYIYIP